MNLINNFLKKITSPSSLNSLDSIIDHPKISKEALFARQVFLSTQADLRSENKNIKDKNILYFDETTMKTLFNKVQYNLSKRDIEKILLNDVTLQKFLMDSTQKEKAEEAKNELIKVFTMNSQKNTQKKEIKDSKDDEQDFSVIDKDELVRDQKKRDAFINDPEIRKLLSKNTLDYLRHNDELSLKKINELLKNDGFEKIRQNHINQGIMKKEFKEQSHYVRDKLIETFCTDTSFENLEKKTYTN